MEQKVTDQEKITHHTNRKECICTSSAEERNSTDPTGSAHLTYRKERIRDFARRWWHLFQNDVDGRKRWVADKARDLSAFLQAYVAGMALYFAAIAIVPYTNCGDYWWRWIPPLGLVTGALALTFAAAARWSLSFTWYTMQRISRYSAFTLMIVTAMAASDIAAWSHPTGFSASDPKCVMHATFYHWPVR